MTCVWSFTGLMNFLLGLRCLVLTHACNNKYLYLFLFLQRLPAIIPLRQNFKELNYTITAGLVPFSRYTFAVSCKFFDLSAYKSGPSVYTEMTSREEGKSFNVRLNFKFIMARHFAVFPANV